MIWHFHKCCNVLIKSNSIKLPFLSVVVEKVAEGE